MEATFPTVDLVRLSGLPALTGYHLIEISPRLSIFYSTVIFVSDGHQVLPFTKSREVETGDPIGTPTAPLLALPLTSLTPPSTLPLLLASTKLSILRLQVPPLATRPRTLQQIPNLPHPIFLLYSPKTDEFIFPAMTPSSTPICDRFTWIFMIRD